MAAIAAVVASNAAVTAGIRRVNQTAAKIAVAAARPAQPGALLRNSTR